MLVIPTTEDPYYEQRTALDGSTYVFQFLYHGRDDRWAFNLLTPDGTPIVMGCRIVPHIGLLRRYHYRAACPPGDIVCLAYGPDDSPPGLLDLMPGGRCELAYMPWRELLG